MRSSITQSTADAMTKVDSTRQALKNEIAELQRTIENANRTMSVAKLSLAHLEMARSRDWSRAS
jgi:hypothetical protein